MATLSTTVPTFRRPSQAAACRAAQVLAALLLAVLPAGGRLAPAASPCPRADVWVVSTRRLPGICAPPEHAAPDVERLSCGDHGRWERSSVEALVADPDRPLVVFIHGNRYAPEEAKSQGVQLARLVAARCPDAGPVRTIIFSWPSAQQGPLLRDARTKYGRAHADGHYLAALLGSVDPERPVAIVGYSFGAIVGLQALQDLAIREQQGDGATSPWPGRPGRTHLVLVVPAVRHNALAPCGPYRDALAGVDHFTLVANSSDIALKFFHCVDRDDALGVTVMPRRWLPAGVEYAALDAAEHVGCEHRLPQYLECGPLARRITHGAVGGFGPPAAH